MTTSGSECELDPDLEPTSRPLSSKRATQPPATDPLPPRLSSPPLSGPPVSHDAGPPPVHHDIGPAFRLGDDGSSPLELHFEGQSRPPCRVLRLSPEVLWFHCDPGSAQGLPSRAHIRLVGSGRSIGPLPARVSPIESSRRGPLHGAKLGQVSLEVGRQIVGLLYDLVAAGHAVAVGSAAPFRLETQEHARIQSLLLSLYDAAEWGRVEGAPVTRARIADLTQDGMIRWEVEGPLPPGPHVVEMHGYNSVYRIHLQRPLHDGLFCALPPRVERTRFRAARRARVEERCEIELNHPRWELGLLRRDVYDLSFGGLSFTCKLDEDLLYPGMRIPLLELHPAGSPPLKLSGEIHHVHPLPGRLGICGMRVRPLLAEDEDPWAALVLRTLNRNTDCGPRFTEQMWDLFTRSGYFNLSGKAPEEFEEIRRSFGAVAESTATQIKLSCQAVWPSERGVEASCSMLKPYDSTWMLHQVAKRRGDGRRSAGKVSHVLRDIYLRSFEHAQADAGCKWLVAFVEESVPWMQRSHIAFGERYAETDLAMALPFRLMEGLFSDQNEGLLHGFEIGPLPAEDEPAFLSAVSQARPTPYLEALDLVPSRFRLTDVRAHWHRIGFERDRSVLVARRKGRAVAAAVLETGETGTNLFRLLDGARLYRLVEGGTEAFPCLLEAARRWYRARGRASFIYFNEDLADEAHPRLAKMRDLGMGRFWACAANLLPEFLEFVFELTARSPLYSVPSARVPGT